MSLRCSSPWNWNRGRMTQMNGSRRLILPWIVRCGFKTRSAAKCMELETGYRRNPTPLAPALCVPMRLTFALHLLSADESTQRSRSGQNVAQDFRADPSVASRPDPQHHVRAVLRTAVFPPPHRRSESSPRTLGSRRSTGAHGASRSRSVGPRGLRGVRNAFRRKVVTGSH